MILFRLNLVWGHRASIMMIIIMAPATLLAQKSALTDKKESKSALQLTTVVEDSGVGYMVRNHSSENIKLSSNWEVIAFNFSHPPHATGFEYSYQLVGRDKTWSGWTSGSSVRYTALESGEYIFNVRSRNQSANLAGTVSYPFKIAAPWYKTTWASACFILCGCILIYFFIQKQLRYTEQQSKYKLSPDLIDFYHVESNKITTSLEKEELVTEINFKNKELATVTMHLVERGKLISKIREELVMALKNHESLAASSEFKAILRMLSDAEKNRHDWEQFSIHFDEVHRNFLSVLKSQYPALSTTDLKLCAYLRLNLSSKEIAQSMNITVKGVEVSRYRLRKKLTISKDVNLFDYLLQVTSTSDVKHSAGLPDDVSTQEDDLAKFLSFFNKSMTAKFISQGGYDFSGEGIIFKRSIAHNKG